MSTLLQTSSPQHALTRNQFAAALQISTSFVNKLLRAKSINAIRIGRSVRIPVSELTRISKEGGVR